MKGLDKGGQGPTSGCCAIEEEEELRVQLASSITENLHFPVRMYRSQYNY
jgi:hypothetical protein